MYKLSRPSMTRHNVIQIKGMYVSGANVPLLDHFSGHQTFLVMQGTWHFFKLSQCSKSCFHEVMLISKSL